MHKALHYCLLWLLAGTCYGSQPTLTFCHEDQNAYPWVMTDGAGLNLELLNLVQQALKLQVGYVAVPWRRCLSGMQQGLYDGAFAASFKTERLQMGHYPTNTDGRPDALRRLHISRYTLYRRVGSMVSWDGQRFSQLSGRGGSLSGFSIRDLLLAHGLEVGESSRDPLALLQMLVHGRVEAIALQTMRGDFLLQANPKLAAQVEKLPQLLEEKPYYLMLSKALLVRDPELAERIWSEVQRQRESATYQARVKAYLTQPGL